MLPRSDGPARGHYRPKEPRTCFHRRGHCTLQTQKSNEATDGLAPSGFDHIRAQLEQILAFVRQEAKKTRGEKPQVRIRVVLPRPGVPGRGHCKPKFQHGS